jgi:hypothetical protein
MGTIEKIYGSFKSGISFYGKHLSRKNIDGKMIYNGQLMVPFYPEDSFREVVEVKDMGGVAIATNKNMLSVACGLDDAVFRNDNYRGMHIDGERVHPLLRGVNFYVFDLEMNLLHSRAFDTYGHYYAWQGMSDYIDWILTLDNVRAHLITFDAWS